MEPRRRRLLPKTPAGVVLESSISSLTSLEDSRKERRSTVELTTTTTSREERSTADSVATITMTTTTRGWRTVITYPTQTTFTSPVCSVSYHLYSSLKRHMRDRHKDRKVTWVYVCADCGEKFQDKKKVSTHVNRVHTSKAMKKDIKSGAFPCDY